MKRIMAVAIALALSGCIAPARSEPAAKITVSQAQGLLVALRNLDGHQVVVKQNGADVILAQPWDFGSGTLRLRIANNITILELTEKAIETARTGIIKEITKGGRAIQPGTPEMDSFQAQFTEVLNSPAQGTQDLSRIKASELKLDKNEIGVTTLAALKPILDDDVSKK